MSDLARAIQAANQRTEDLQADYSVLRERKEKLEEQLAICIGWLGEAEVRAADADVDKEAFRGEAERLAGLAADRLERLTAREEELTMIALALKNEGVGDDSPDHQVTPERGVEILIEQRRELRRQVEDLEGDLEEIQTGRRA